MPSSPSRRTSAATAPPDAPRLDGRRAHVLDRAAEYVRLADQGLSAAQIARRRRKSPAHVSILLRLGRALAAVPDGERAALRSPRVTWRLVQRLVRADVDPASLRKQLRDAVGGFSTHNVDARRRGRRAAAPGAAAPSPAPAPTAARGVAWGWDAAWFAADPVGYAAAHLAHLTHVHEVVAGRAAQAVRARARDDLARVDAGQSLRGLQRRLREATGATRADAAATPEERHALEAFAALGRALQDARAAVAALEPQGHRGEPRRATTADAATADEIAADLDEL